MRKQFVKTLIELAQKDKDIILLTGDVGFGYLEPFQKALPDQFINVGLAEQNMVGIATGLALAGKKPWAYSMITFLLFRPYEQIRTACHHNANVKFVGFSGWAGYKFLGFSHNMVGDEDKNLLRALPNIKSHYCDDRQGVEAVVKLECERAGPAYIKI